MRCVYATVTSATSSGGLGVLTGSKIENLNTGKTTTIYEANIIGVE